MPDSPVVSVVIPTYNAPALLLETLATVFAQTYRAFEVIVINDGSTDDTLQQLQPLQDQHGTQLRVITQPNAGIGAARNRGISESRGHYIAFLDHDDLWYPQKLEIQVQYMQSHPECASCGTLFIFSSLPGELHFQLQDVADDRGIVHRPFLNAALGISVFQSCTLMIDRERCAGLGYATVPGAIEDVSFHALLLTRGAYGIAGTRCLASYRMYEGNFSKKPSFYYTGLKLLRSLQKQGLFAALAQQHQDDLNLFLANVARICCTMQIRSGDRQRGVEVYKNEFLNQLSRRRFRFLLIVPLMLLLSPALIERWIYKNSSAR